MPYAIVDWDEIYEKARTREVAAMTWVAIPNKQDGEGYACLVEDDPDGPAHYGAWVALVLVASKCPSRGVLIRKDGTALTPRAIAKKARLPVDLMKAAIPRFLQIGWLCELTAPPSHAGTTMHDDVVQASDNVVQDRADAHYTTGQNTKRKPEQDRTGQDKTESEETGSDFAAVDLTDSDFGPDAPERKDAYDRWILSTSKLWAKEAAQRAADETCAGQWFLDLIWPVGLPEAQGRARVTKARKHLRNARTKARPMSWLTKVLREETWT